MQKAGHTPGRIAVMALFALSCFGLLLFLWLSFGGAVPLKPKGYRVQVAFPEAATLGLEADVRVAGVSVGKVRKKELLDGGNRTLVTMEIDRAFAPVASDAKAMLREKTLLGETYVELTPGQGGKPVPENGRLEGGQVREAVQLDEIFQALDPQTRSAFRRWQQDLGSGIADRGRDFNDSLATLPGFARDAGDLLEVLDVQERSLSRLIKNTGTVFGALTENEAQLRNLITGSARVFRATASRDEALAETIRIFPTFLDESKLVLGRLKTFSRDTRPLIRDLRPVARDLGPTVRDLRAFAPDLERTFRDLDPLIAASKRGLPATTQTLRALRPLLGELGPFLGQINPILEFLELHQGQVAEFISNGASPLADTTFSPSGGVGHYLRQFGPTGPESAAIYRRRLSSNRGNTYLPPLALSPNPKAVEFRMFPNFDCRASGGEVKPEDAPNGGRLGCWVAPPQLGTRFPRLTEKNYSAAGK